MTDDNSNPVDMDDLDAFETEFYQREAATEDQKDEEKKESAENEDDPLAAEEDKDAPKEGDEAEDEDEGEDDSEEEEVEPEPKPKPKSKAQQRIEKLLERERLATERANALEARLTALEAQKPKEEKHEEQAPAIRDQLPADAPNPDAKDKDGEPVYPLGEFDPKFIRDLSQYTVESMLKSKQEQEQRDAYERQLAAQRSEIQNNWHSKLEAVEEEIPDIRESISELVDTFQNLDPQYGEYLASVIMANEVGPQIMHYLSQNIGEAQKIVASGPAAATLAIGRLEARLTPVVNEEKRNTKRVSDAPRPPASQSRGSGGRFATSPDTDDLDAFEREFFKRK